MQIMGHQFSNFTQTSKKKEASQNASQNKNKIAFSYHTLFPKFFGKNNIDPSNACVFPISSSC